MVIWGPSRLGGLGRGIGEAIRGFKKGLNTDDTIDVTHTLNQNPQNNDSSGGQIREANTADNTSASTVHKDRTRS